jgi:hypothetical protein
MSQGTSLLVQLGGGAMVVVFLPIMIVIALIFASLSSVEEAQACDQHRTDVRMAGGQPRAVGLVRDEPVFDAEPGRPAH